MNRRAYLECQGMTRAISASGTKNGPVRGVGDERTSDLTNALDESMGRRTM